jgi:antitoxin (DNA-binding transcriptional repressor) of toxin-antitoxin stability system
MMASHQESPVMRTVGIAELKNRLSYYLRRVQRGEAVLVCDRDRVIARIERVAPQEALPPGEAEWLDRLERAGVIRRAQGALPRGWLARKPVVSADVVAALLHERAEGR